MLNVMRRYALGALVLGLAVVAAGCGTSRAREVGGPAVVLPFEIAGHTSEPGNHVGPGPFAVSGGFAAGGSGGLMGDVGSRPAGGGMSLGCQNGERWSYAFGLVNTSKAPVTLTSVRAPNPAPAIADRVATQ